MKLKDEYRAGELELLVATGEVSRRDAEEYVKVYDCDGCNSYHWERPKDSE